MEKQYKNAAKELKLKLKNIKNDIFSSKSALDVAKKECIGKTFKQIDPTLLSDTGVFIKQIADIVDADWYELGPGDYGIRFTAKFTDGTTHGYEMDLNY